MEELIELWDLNLATAGKVAELALNAIALIFILTGVGVCVLRIFQNRHDLSRGTSLFRMTFAGWLIVALDFQIAADIAGTIVSPSSENLIRLAVVAVIRTFLSYFLNKEFKYEMDESHNELKKSIPHIKTVESQEFF